MREVLRLTRVGLINGFNLQGLNLKKILQDKKQLLKYIGYLVLVVFFVVLYVGYIKFIEQLTAGFISLNQETYTNALVYNLLSILIFIFGIPYIMAYFYFSRDTEMLLALPIKPRNIVLSKFIMLTLFEYILVFLMMIPVVVISGSALHAGVSYYLIALIVIGMIPIAPLALCGIIIILLSRIINLGSKKNLIRGIFLFAVTFSAIGIQLYIQKHAMDIEQNQNFIMELISNNQSMINMLGDANPFAKWLGNALDPMVTTGSIVSLLYFCIGNLLIFALFILVGEKIYLGSIIGGHEVATKKKQLSEEAFNREISKGNRPYMAIFKTDMITMFKTPIYLFNCFGVVIILPVILTFSFVTGSQMEGLSIHLLQDIYNNNTQLAGFILAGAIMLTGAMTPIAPTTFSREGKYFWISRVIPVSAKEHIIGRSMTAMVAQLCLALMLIIGLNIGIALDLSTYYYIALGLLGSIPIILSGMLIDIEKPLLNWTNPQRAVKQNMNAVFGMLAGLLITAVLGGLTYLMLQTAMHHVLIFIAVAILIIVLTVMVYKVLEKRIRIRFIEINM